MNLKWWWKTIPFSRIIAKTQVYYDNSNTKAWHQFLKVATEPLRVAYVSFCKESGRDVVRDYNVDFIFGRFLFFDNNNKTSQTRRWKHIDEESENINRLEIQTDSIGSENLTWHLKTSKTRGRLNYCMAIVGLSTRRGVQFRQWSRDRSVVNEILNLVAEAMTLISSMTRHLMEGTEGIGVMVRWKLLR